MNFFWYPIISLKFITENTACLNWGCKDIILNNLSQMFLKKIQLKADVYEKPQNGKFANQRVNRRYN